MSAKHLIENILRTKSILCVGLDPTVNQLPAVLKKEIEAKGKTIESAAEALLSFNKSIIDAICDIVPVVKPQSAYYEALGYQGVKVYHETIQYAKSKGLYVIGDIKRGDIGSTSKAYADGHLGLTDILGLQQPLFDTDAVTINPYLGDDSNNEFFKVAKEHNKMNFLLVKTSNPGSHQIQNKVTEQGTIFENVANDLVNNPYYETNEYGYSNLGAVVGATYPDELKKLRGLMPGIFLLIPGYGAQGGTSDDVVHGFDKRGLGAIVNSSRGIIYAFKDKNDTENYVESIRKAAIAANLDLNGALERSGIVIGGQNE